MSFEQQLADLVADLDSVISTETVRARHIRLVRIREGLAALCARDPEN